MKLIFAIVNKDDSASVAAAVTKAGFSMTKLATTGGFLMAGNTTFLLGTEDDKVEEAIEVIKTHAKKRTRVVSSTAIGTPVMGAVPMEVTVGGATIFVTDIERFEKV